MRCFYLLHGAHVSAVDEEVCFGGYAGLEFTPVIFYKLSENTPFNLLKRTGEDDFLT